MTETTAGQASGLDAAQRHDNLAHDMIRLIVREVAERAGFSSARALSRASGIPYESCRLLWNGESRMIALDTLEKLCQTLEVPPAQLLLYEPEKKKSGK